MQQEMMTTESYRYNCSCAKHMQVNVLHMKQSKCSSVGDRLSILWYIHSLGNICSKKKDWWCFLCTNIEIFLRYLVKNNLGQYVEYAAA